MKRLATLSTLILLPSAQRIPNDTVPADVAEPAAQKLLKLKVSSLKNTTKKLQFLNSVNDDQKKIFIKFLEQYATDHHIDFKYDTNQLTSDQKINLILQAIPEETRLPECLDAYTANNDSELHLKELFLNAKMDSPKCRSGYKDWSEDKIIACVEDATGLSIEEVSALIISESFHIPKRCFGFLKDCKDKLGYINPLMSLELYDRPQLFKALVPKGSPKIKKIQDQYKTGNGYYTIKLCDPKGTTSKGIFHTYENSISPIELDLSSEIVNLKIAAIRNNDPHMLKVAFESGYELTEQDSTMILSSPRTSFHAWDKYKTQFKLSNQDALEIIQNYLDSTKDEFLAFCALPLYIHEAINVAEENKKLSADERENIKKELLQEIQSVNNITVENKKFSAQEREKILEELLNKLNAANKDQSNKFTLVFASLFLISLATISRRHHQLEDKFQKLQDYCRPLLLDNPEGQENDIELSTPIGRVRSE